MADVPPIAEDSEPNSNLVLKDLPDRLTIVLNVTHQSSDYRATHVSAPFERLLAVREQVFERHLHLKESPAPLIAERCWLEAGQIGLVILQNNSKKNPLRLYLSADHAGELVGSLDYSICIGPGESQPITLNNPKQAVVCGVVETPYTIYVFPR